MSDELRFETQTVEEDGKVTGEKIYADGRVEKLENDEVVGEDKVEAPPLPEDADSLGGDATTGGRTAEQQEAAVAEQGPAFSPVNDAEARAEAQKEEQGEGSDLTSAEWREAKKEETQKNVEELESLTEEERARFAATVEEGPPFVPTTIEEARAEGQKLAADTDVNEAKGNTDDTTKEAEEQSSRAPEEKVEAEEAEDEAKGKEDAKKSTRRKKS